MASPVSRPGACSSCLPGSAGSPAVSRAAACVQLCSSAITSSRFSVARSNAAKYRASCIGENAGLMRPENGSASAAATGSAWASCAWAVVNPAAAPASPPDAARKPRREDFARVIAPASTYSRHPPRNKSLCHPAASRCRTNPRCRAASAPRRHRSTSPPSVARCRVNLDHLAIQPVHHQQMPVRRHIHRQRPVEQPVF